MPLHLRSYLYSSAVITSMRLSPFDVDVLLTAFYDPTFISVLLIKLTLHTLDLETCSFCVQTVKPIPSERDVSGRLSSSCAAVTEEEGVEGDISASLLSMLSSSPCYLE